MEEPRVRTVADAEAHVRTLTTTSYDLARRVRTIEKVLDTLDTPLWRRIVFRLDGWPSWARTWGRLARGETIRPRWRPWRRWWTS